MLASFSLLRAPIPMPPTTMASTLCLASRASGRHIPWAWWRLPFGMAWQLPFSVSTIGGDYGEYAITRPAPMGMTTSSPYIFLKYPMVLPPVQCPP